MKPVDFALIERWLTGWSLSRGLPRAQQQDGGLVVEVGKPEQLRRHVFLDAGTALQACAERIGAPCIFLKAAVEPAVLRAALPARWTIENPGYLMLGHLPAMAGADALALPPGYRVEFGTEFGAHVVRVLHGDGEVAASGRIVLHAGCAVYDQIVTAETHRRRGLATVVMRALDSLAVKADAAERLLVATEDGRALYTRLGWIVISPWSTAVLPSPAPA